MPVDSLLYPEDFFFQKNVASDKVSDLESIVRTVALQQRLNSLFSMQKSIALQNEQTITNSSRMPLALVGKVVTLPTELGTNGYWFGSNKVTEGTLLNRGITHCYTQSEVTQILGVQLATSRNWSLSFGNQRFGLIAGGGSELYRSFKESLEEFSFLEEIVVMLSESLEDEMGMASTGSTENFGYAFGGSRRNPYDEGRNYGLDSVIKISLENSSNKIQTLQSVNLQDTNSNGPSHCAVSSDRFWIMGGVVDTFFTDKIERFDVLGETLNPIGETLSSEQAFFAIASTDDYNWKVGGISSYLWESLNLQEIARFNNAEETIALASVQIVQQKTGLSCVQTSDKALFAAGFDVEQDQWFNSEVIQKLSPLSDSSPVCHFTGKNLPMQQNVPCSLSDYSPSYAN